MFSATTCCQYPVKILILYNLKQVLLICHVVTYIRSARDVQHTDSKRKENLDFFQLKL